MGDLISVKVGKPTKSKTADFEQVSSLNMSSNQNQCTKKINVKICLIYLDFFNDG